MLAKIGDLIIKKYKLILGVTALVTLVAMFLSSKLIMKTQMMDMLPEDEPQVVSYKQALNNYEGIDMISIIIEGKESDIKKFIHTVQPKLLKVKDVGEVIYKNEVEFTGKNGLLLMKQKDLKSMKPLLQAGSLQGFIKGLNDSFEEEYISGGDSKKLSKDKQQMLQFFNSIEDLLLLLQGGKAVPVEEVADAFIAGPRYLISPDRSLGVMFVKTPLDMNDFQPLIPLVNNIEKVVKTEAKTLNVTAGVAGILVLQRDEMAVTEQDMSKSFGLSLVLILLIFYFGFRLLRYSILALLPLIVGIILSMGITYLVIGSLNIFTAMMAVILIGLGIDYAIHIISLYTEVRVQGIGVEESVKLVFAKTAKGVVIGAITTAISFLMFSVSSFPGFREFGLVLGIGIISTLVVSIVMLPSLFMVFGKKDVARVKPQHTIFVSMEKMILTKPYLAVSLVVIFLILSIIKFPDLKFSKDIKDIEPKGLESLVLNDRLIEKFDISSDTVLTISNTMQEARQLKDKLEDLSTVGMIDSVVNYLPPKNLQTIRLQNISKLQNEIKEQPFKELNLEQLKEELGRLESNLLELSDLSFMGGEKKLVKHLDKLQKSGLINDLIKRAPSLKESLTSLQDQFMTRHRSNVLAMNGSNLIGVKDLPKRIRENYVGKDGSFLTLIYPEGDVWNEHFQPLFLKDMRSLGAPVTGTFILSEKVMQIAGSEGKKVMIYVVIAIFILLIIDFRSLKYAIFAMLPMASTMTLLLGVMSLFGIKFDYVNIMALPIIIGIGVDDGVHLIHRYLIEKDIVPAIKSTGRGILLTSLTTCAAFGTFMVGKYQVFVSFGLV